MTAPQRHKRPAHLRAVPPLSDRQQAAMDRRLYLIQGFINNRPVRITRVPADDMHAMLHAIADAAIEAGASEPTHRVLVDEDGISVDNCIACGGLHHTGWDRVVVGAGNDTESHMAFWPCPNTPPEQPDAMLMEPLNDVDFAEAVEGGTELMPEIENDALILRFRSWIGHPATTATAFGSTPDGGDAA